MPVSEKPLPNVVIPSPEDRSIQVTRFFADKLGDYAQHVKSEHDDFTPRGIETPLTDSAKLRLGTIALSRSIATNREYKLPASES